MRRPVFGFLFSVLMIGTFVLTACTSGDVLPSASNPTPPHVQSATSVPRTTPPATEQADQPSAMPTLPTETTSPAGTIQVCSPTQSDALGPFYTPGAPQRVSVGEGYTLRGVVRSAVDCMPIPNAHIEVWMAGPDGEYRNDYRATFYSDENGAYSFESHFPPPYSGRPSHHHLLVTTPGYQTLVTQHYPQQGENQATFDLVLLPSQ